MTMRITCVITFLLITLMFQLTPVSAIETITTKTSGTFTSSDYWRLYKPNTNDTHIVKANHFRNFLITISSFSVEYSDGCKSDRLTLYDGTENRRRIILGPLCGSIGGHKNKDGYKCYPRDMAGRFSVHLEFLARGFVLVFVTDASIEYTGYVLTYTSSAATVDVICRNMIKKNDDSVEISPYFLHTFKSYPLSTTCEWILDNYTSNKTHSVSVTVTDFALEYSGPSCVSDRLEIHRLPPKTPRNHSHEILNPPFKLCGIVDRFTRFLDDVNHGIRVIFISNPQFNDGHFHVKFKRVQKHIPKTETSVHHEIQITDTKQHDLSLHSVAWEKPCYVEENEICERIIVKLIARHEYRIKIELSEMAAESDLISVFDGPSTKFPVLYDTTSSGFYVTISFFTTILQSGVHYVVVYSAQNVLDSFRNNLYNRGPCSLFGTVDGRLSLNRVTNIQIPTVNSRANYFCLISITVPQGYAISLKIREIHYSHFSNNCDLNGIVVFDGLTNDHSHKLGPFCELKKGYLKALFNPLLTSSNRAFVMLYSYVPEKENRRRDISIDVTAYECNGIHIFPVQNHPQQPFYSMNANNAKTNANNANSHRILPAVSVNNTKFGLRVVSVNLKLNQKCLRLFVHVRSPYSQHQFLFHNTEHAKVSLCEYFRHKKEEDGHKLGHSNSECRREGNKCCMNAIIDTTSTLGRSTLTTKMASGDWTVAFMVLSIGRTEQNPATLIGKCHDTTIENDYEHIINNRENILNIFPGQIAIIKPSDCYITLISNELVGAHYIVLYVQQSNLGNFEITEVLMTRLNKINYYTTVYDNVLPRHLYQSTSYRFLQIYIQSNQHKYETEMFYQLQQYTDYGLKSNNAITSERTMMHYKNWTYSLHKVNSTRNNTYRSLKNYCLKDGGDLISVRTQDILDAIKTAVSTIWVDEFISTYFDQNRSMDIYIGLRKELQLDSTHQWRWTDGSPLTFSDWYYPDQINHYIAKDMKEKLGRQVFSMQPKKGDANRCAMMRIYHPRRSTNWISVDCNNLPHDQKFVICEKVDDTFKNTILEAKTTQLSDGTDFSKDTKRFNHTYKYNYNYADIHQVNTIGNKDKYTNSYKYKQFLADMTCPKNWTFIHGKCWLLLHHKSPVTSIQEVANDCVEYGGTVADIRNVDGLREYLSSVKYREIYGSIWMLTNGNESCVGYRIQTDLTEPEMDRLELRIGKDCAMERVYYGEYSKYVVVIWPNHVFCVRDVVKIPKLCHHGYLQCNDGSCVSHDLVCDGVGDCASGEDETDCDVQDYFYECLKGTEQISVSKYCDFIKDCSDGSDENGCVYPRCSHGQFRCDSGQCVDVMTRCNGKHDSCVDLSDEKSCRSGKNCFLCENDICIHPSKISDHRSDCDDSSDEPVMFDYTNVLQNCAAEEGQCSEQNVGCFNRGEACVLAYDTDGRKRGCSNGEHLANCEGFQCPGRYKCPDSYCIDMKRVCNGIQDCQRGEDEAQCGDTRCPGLYRCGGNQTFCLESKSICNGEFDCINHSSDEKYCNLPECHKGCICRGYFYNCEGNRMSSVNSNISRLARYLNLGWNNLDDAITNNYTFSHFSFLAYLGLSHNQIHHINRHTFTGLHNLITLNLSHNLITTLGTNLFKDLGRLQNLILTGNTISTLQNNSFFGLLSISTLNLNNLGIKELHSGSLNGLDSLKTLNLAANDINYIESNVFVKTYRFNLVQITGNHMKNVPVDVFQNITSEVIEASDFRFCCYINFTTSCTPSVDTYSSCDDLLSNRFFRIIVWIMGILSIVGNVSVVITTIIIGIKGPLEVCILALCFSDLLTGLYLIIIAGADTFYRGVYIFHDTEWKASALCQISGVISTLSSQLSSFLLLLLTLDRFIHLVFPIGVVFYNRKSAIITCEILFLVSIMESVTPLLIPSYFGDDFYGKTPLCVAYDFTAARSPGWEYTMSLFVLVNLFNCLLMVVCYVIMYISVRRSSKRRDREHTEDIDLAKTIFLMVLTDVICWFFIIVTSLSVLNGHTVSRDMAAILVVVVLPINSALNPYIYAISSVWNARNRKAAYDTRQRKRRAVTFYEEEKMIDKYG